MAVAQLLPLLLCHVAVPALTLNDPPLPSSSFYAPLQQQHVIRDWFDITGTISISLSAESQWSESLRNGLLAAVQEAADVTPQSRVSVTTAATTEDSSTEWDFAVRARPEFADARQAIDDMNPAWNRLNEAMLPAGGEAVPAFRTTLIDHGFPSDVSFEVVTPPNFRIMSGGVVEQLSTLSNTFSALMTSASERTDEDTSREADMRSTAQKAHMEMSHFLDVVNAEHERLRLSLRDATSYHARVETQIAVYETLASEIRESMLNEDSSFDKAIRNSQNEVNRIRASEDVFYRISRELGGIWDAQRENSVAKEALSDAETALNYATTRLDTEMEHQGACRKMSVANQHEMEKGLHEIAKISESYEKLKGLAMDRIQRLTRDDAEIVILIAAIKTELERDETLIAKQTELFVKETVATNLATEQAQRSNNLFTALTRQAIVNNAAAEAAKGYD